MNGWYTKKVNGKKITKVTKVKNKVTFHAQWKKNTNANTESEVIGSWMYYHPVKGYCTYVFKKDGTFNYFEPGQYSTSYYNEKDITKGKYRVSSGKLYLTNVEESGVKWPDMVIEYSVTKEDGKPVLNIARLYKTPYIDMKDSRPFHY